ncbi:TPA: hypothetical protein ACGBRK_005021, partial [Escherichia coli]
CSKTESAGVGGKVHGERAITSLDGRGVECVVRKYSIRAIGTDEVTAGAFPSFSTGGYEAFAENDGTKLKCRNYLCSVVVRVKSPFFVLIIIIYETTITQSAWRRLFWPVL